MYSQKSLPTAVYLVLFLCARVQPIGTSFLKVPSNPRELALGGFTASVPGDPSLFRGNPALIVQSIPSTKLFFGYHVWFAGTRGSSFLLTNPAFDGTFGLGLRYLGLTNLELRTATPTDEMLTFFGASGSAVEFTWGRRVDLPVPLFGAKGISSLQLGTTVRWVRIEMYTHTASGVAFDLGAWFPLFRGRLSLGTAVQNLGSMSHLMDKSPELPTTFLAGVTLQTSSDRIHRPNRPRSSLTLGVEASRVHGAVFRVAGEVSQSTLHLTLGTKFAEEVTSIAGSFAMSWRRFQIGYGVEVGSHRVGIPHLFEVSVTLP